MRKNLMTEYKELKAMKESWDNSFPPNNVGRSVAWQSGKQGKDLMLGRIVEDKQSSVFYTVSFISMTPARKNALRPAFGATFLVQKEIVQFQQEKL